MIKINDGSKDKIYSSNIELIDNFTDYSSKNLDFDKPVEIDFLDNEDNAKNPLGTTAHYNPDEMKITIYVTGRHLKDILRSISHELIHHVQNCRGDFNGMEDTGLGYAQKDKHMRGMEQEAYTAGNIMNFRDFEDTYKKENRQMKTTLKELKKIINEELDNLKEQSALPSGVSAGGLFGGVNLKTKEINSISKCISPRKVGQYISSQLDSVGVNNSELKLMHLGIKACASKQKLHFVPGGTFGISKSNNLSDLKRKIDFGITAITGVQRKLKNKINKTIETYIVPTSTTSPTQVNKCPDGTREDQRGRCLNTDNKVVAVIKSQHKPSTTASPTPRRTKRKCLKLPLRRGCTGELVKKIQKLLILVGYGRQLGKTGADGDGADGNYGGRTARAVKEFQKAQIKAGKLPAKNKRGRSNVDGVAGKLTVQALKNLAKGVKAKPASASPKVKPASASPIPKRFTAQQIGAVLKNMNKVVSPEDPKAKAIIKKLMMAQDKGEQLDLKKIKRVADTM